MSTVFDCLINLVRRLGAYLVGEFGHLISDEASGKQQLQVLHRHFGRVSSSTKALLLLAYAKLLSAHEELTNQVRLVPLIQIACCLFPSSVFKLFELHSALCKCLCV